MKSLQPIFFVMGEKLVAWLGIIELYLVDVNTGKAISSYRVRV